MKKFLIFTITCLIVTASAFAQTKTVTGKVIGGDDRQGVPGASVIVKETGRGEAADIDGAFSIQAAKGQTLVFSAIGYAQHTIVVGDDNVINVTLQQDISVLSEAVVVAYGTQKKEHLTGAVASVDVNKAMGSRPVGDVGRGLQGAAAGVIVTNPSGEVGGDPIIKIRGAIGSYAGSNNPLILLDGVEIPSISIINPDNVEGISILKDAASASIYGSKAAFGVIMITSKKGAKAEQVNVSYNNNFSFQNTAYDLKMGQLSALQYTMDAYHRTSSGGVQGAFWYVDANSLARAYMWKEKYGKTVKPNDPVVYGRDWYVNPGTTNQKMGLRTYDMYDYMIREWAPSQTHNLAISGKTGNTAYNMNLGYLLQNGMMKPAKKDQFERYNASLSLTTEVNKYFTAKANFMYSRRDKQYAYSTSSTTADQWLYLYRWGPLYPMTDDENGHPLRSPAYETATANTASLYNAYTSINFGGVFTFTPNWKLNAEFTYSENNEIQHRPGTSYLAGDTWVAPVAKNNANGTRATVTDEWGINGGNPLDAYMLNYYRYTASGANPDHVFRSSANLQRTTTDVYSTYNLKLGEDHNFTFMAGLTRQTYDYKYHASQVTTLTKYDDPYFTDAVGAQSTPSITVPIDWNALVGYFGRINYSYQDKYLFEATLRYDGTSKFPKHLRWRWYPSVSAGWNISNESFFEPLKSVVTMAKLRASYGVVGDQAVDNGLYMSTMGVRNGGGWLLGNTQAVYFTTPTVFTYDIGWQDIQNLNIGADFRFFNNKLGLTVEWYQRTTANMLVGGLAVPTAFGTSASYGNYGSLQTTGWEIAVDFNHRFQNGLGINVMASLTDYKSKITKYVAGASKTVTSTAWWDGRIYGDIYGYTTDRLYTWDDFVLTGDGTKKWANLQRVKLGATSVTAAEAAAGVIPDPNPGRNYGSSAGMIVFQQKGHETAVYQARLQSGALLFGPGDVKFKDLDGDGEIYYGAGRLDNMGDLSKIGNSTPRWEYGIRLGADWKGFDASVFIQGVGSRQIQPYSFLAVAGWNTSDGAMPDAIASNSWSWNEEKQTGNTGAFYPRPTNYAGVDPAYAGTLNNVVQSKYLLDMSYMRIKNITIGYTLPAEIIKKVYLNKARVYLSLENYFTFDNLHGLPIDPEEVTGYSMFNTSNYNSSRTGVGTPTFKSLSFGIQLTF